VSGVDHDESILRQLRRIAAAVDPVPSAVVDLARAALSTRDLDAEIAGLIADSRAEAFEPTRADDPAQGQWLLSFHGGGIHIDLEIEEQNPGVRVIGQLSGATIDDCDLDFHGRSVPVDLDSLGRFIVPGLAPGPIRLRCRLSGGRRVTTTWVRI
jgi:hypothetical protein